MARRGSCDHRGWPSGACPKAEVGFPETSPMPWTVDTILWGLAIGAAALLAAILVCLTLQVWVRNNNIASIGAAFVLAFAAYEGGLFLVTFALGGAGAFTPAIIGHVGLLNLGWTVGLVGTYQILRYSGAVTAQNRRGSSAPFPV